MSQTRFGITVTSRMRHAALLSAARKCGSAAALAQQLGVGSTELGRWINLQGVPPFLKQRIESGQQRAAHKAMIQKHWPPERISKLEQQLFDLTLKTLAELFPEELCANAEFLAAKKQVEATKEFTPALISHTHCRLLLPPPDETVEAADFRNHQRKQLAQALNTLSFREREIIKLRYGLGDGYTYTLNEVGHIFNVNRERVRQIEAKAIRKLQQPVRKAQLASCVE